MAPAQQRLRQRERERESRREGLWEDREGEIGRPRRRWRRGTGGMTKQCELCERPARMYCESDQARLCWECDARVHGANFLVARHSRSLLCRSCQAPTPWQASGSWLGPTVSVCEACLGGGGAGDVSEKGEMGGVGGRPADGGRDLQEEEEDDEGGEDEEDEDEGEEEDEDGENQVVPLSMQAGTTTTATAPSVASCSSSEESSSSRGDAGRSLPQSGRRRRPHPPSTAAAHSPGSGRMLGQASGRAARPGRPAGSAASGCLATWRITNR